MTEGPLEYGMRYPDSEDDALQTHLQITFDLKGQKWVVSGHGTRDEFSFFLLQAYSEALEEAFEQYTSDGLVQTPETIFTSIEKKLRAWGRLKFYEWQPGDETDE